MANIVVETLEQLKPFLNDDGVLEVIRRDNGKKIREIPKIVLNRVKNSEDSDLADKVSRVLANETKGGKKAVNSLNLAKLNNLNLIMNGINLCATCVGFVIMFDKLDKMSGQINKKLNAIKGELELQTQFELSKTLSKHMDMLDSRRRKQFYSEKEMRELVDEEYNVLVLLIKGLQNDPVGDVDSLILSIYSMASMLATSIRYFDELYYFNNTETIEDGNPWHSAHSRWMGVFEMLLSPEFVEIIQDHGFFNLNMSTIENDAYYLSLCEQVKEIKESVEDNQYLIKRLGSKEMLDAFFEYNRQTSREKVEKTFEEAGISLSDSAVSEALDEAFKQVALA